MREGSKAVWNFSEKSSDLVAPPFPSLKRAYNRTKKMLKVQNMQSTQNLQTEPTKPNQTKPKLLVKAINAWVRSAFGNVSYNNLEIGW